ncbi:conserved hypothetical protein [Ricinus communis]|uniref:Uncharacterized protein n=1 Tax=Ricinus communis TaxID=3988 RepID=B9TL52_RICCO|nr:conserved hypothetical protein [Ricinus communis]
MARIFKTDSRAEVEQRLAQAGRRVALATERRAANTYPLPGRDHSSGDGRAGVLQPGAAASRQLPGGGRTQRFAVAGWRGAHAAAGVFRRRQHHPRRNHDHHRPGLRGLRGAL